MKTLEEILELVESVNEEAHSDAWDSWIAADEMEDSDEDGSAAEQLREEASDEQAGYFRQGYWASSEDDQAAIKHWLKEDESFKDQFSSWFGYDAFENEFGVEE